MEFLIVAYDGKDVGAKERRIKARPAHLEGAKVLQAADHLLSGGAILDDAGEVIGSTLYMDFPSRAELDQWLQTDPYTTGGVWRDIQVLPIRLAIR